MSLWDKINSYFSINTSGGAVVGGDVNTAGGHFIGRDYVTIQFASLQKTTYQSLSQDLESESKQVQQILQTRPKCWEFLLTLELLRPRVTDARRRINDLQRGVTFVPAKIMRGQEFTAWLQAKLEDLGYLGHLIITVLNEDLQRSWGKKGEPGNPLEIKNAVDKLVIACDALVVWEIDMRSVRPPQEALRLRQLTEGWAVELFEELEEFQEKLATIIRKMEPGKDYMLEVTWGEPRNIKVINDELKRLKKGSKKWLDRY